MKISTKYNIGHEFWIPQVLEHEETESVTVDQKVYERRVTVLTVAARPRVVIGIEITVRRSDVDTRYRCTAPDLVGLTGARLYHEDDLMFVDQEHALNFARLWRDTEGRSYPGVKDECDDQAHG